jgi:FixJ family two-component response regulator
MPRLNGIQVLEQLYERHLEIPTILMTFHGSEEIAIEVYRMGVKDYIKKPYYPEEMLDSIEKALTETRLRQEKDALTNRVIQANQELQKRITEFEILFNIGEFITTTTNLTKLLPKVVDAAVEITEAEEGHISLIENNQLVRRAHKPPRLQAAQLTEQIVKDQVAAHVITKKEALLLDPERLQKNVKGDTAPNSIACVPIQFGERVLGVLQVVNYSADKETFNRNDGRTLQTLSDHAAIAIENARNYAALVAAQKKISEG